MKTLFDTSVLVPALLSHHFHFPLAAPWLRRAHASEFPWFVAAHSLAECYSTLTASARSLRVPPITAERLIRENITSRASSIVELSAAEYESSIHMAVLRNLTSGFVYDAILIAAAQKAGVDRLLTFNLKHFLRLWPAGADIITSP